MNSEMTFGQFVKMQREKLGKTLRGTAAELEIAPAYLCDIEKGNRIPAKKHLENFLDCLHIRDEHIAFFYDLLGQARDGIYPDLNDYIYHSDIARVALRKARDNNIPDVIWVQFINSIELSGG